MFFKKYKAQRTELVLITQKLPPFLPYITSWECEHKYKIKLLKH